MRESIEGREDWVEETKKIIKYSHIGVQKFREFGRSYLESIEGTEDYVSYSITNTRLGRMFYIYKIFNARRTSLFKILNLVINKVFCLLKRRITHVVEPF